MAYVAGGIFSVHSTFNVALKLCGIEVSNQTCVENTTFIKEILESLVCELLLYSLTGGVNRKV